jgi:hypothetical protein
MQTTPYSNSSLRLRRTSPAGPTIEILKIEAKK